MKTKPRPDGIHDARNLPIFVIEDALIDLHGAQIGAYGVAVYTTLARFAKRDHATILAYQTIADTLKLSKTTVRATLKNLAKAGIIQIEQQTDDKGAPIASNRYTLLPIGDTKAISQAEGGSATRQGVAPHDTPHASGDMGVAPHDSPYRDTHGGVSPDAYIDKYHVGVVGSVGVGDRARENLFVELRRRKISRIKAEAICATIATAADILTSIDNLYDPANPQTMGGVINLLIDAPPTEGHPYERPIEQRPAAPDNTRGHARSTGRAAIHNQRGTGGSDIKDPGWRERLVARAEAGELP
jgi:biotin operon repressor